jgi:Kef-type K+ transport system membrane component KefB
MKKVLLYSLLLVGGLIASQFLAGIGATAIKLGTMFCLAFIMIHVGYEFDIDKARPRQYAWDYVVAGTAAAGLATTWVFKKARVVAIFDDLDTILLMIPLKIWMVGMKWQLGVIVLVIAVLLWGAWRYLHVLRLPESWPWVMLYAGVITGVCEAIYLSSKVIDDTVPVHLEVLLPAFVLGCMLARPAGHDPHVDDAREGHQEGPESAGEQRVATIVSAVFMVLVGLSMPVIPRAGINWGVVAAHVVLITVLSNLGKMFPAFCYRQEATLRERLALSIGMFPRGEVGAGVLVVSVSYGLGGTALTVAVLSLALNLLLTGVFIAAVKKLIAPPKAV